LPTTTSAGTVFQLNAAHIDTLTLTSSNTTATGFNTGTINVYKGIIVNNPSLTTGLGNVIFQGPNTPFINATTPVNFTTSQFYAGINNISTATGTSTIPPVSLGTATFQGSASQTIGSTLTPAPKTVFTNITIAEPASVTLGMNILDTAATGTVNIMGKLDVGSYTITGGGGNFIVNGLASKTINGTTGGANPIATITAGSTAINAGVSYIPIGAKVTCVNNASYIPANTYVVSYSTAGNYVISNPATYTASGGNGIDSATLSLNFTMPSGTLITANSGGVSASAPGFSNYNAAYASFGTPIGSYTFNNTTATPFVTNAASPFTVNNLTVANGATVSSNKSYLNLSGTLALNSGIFNIPVSDTVRITSGNAITTTAFFDNTNYVNTSVDAGTGAKGLLRMDAFSAARTFPVGANGNYLPVTITPDTLSSFYVSAFNNATIDGTPNGTALSASQKDTSVNAMYIVNKISPATTHTYTLGLGYPSSLKGTTFATYTNQIGISHYNGSVWSVVHGYGDNTSNTATDTVSSFGVFYVTHNSTTAILPVKLGALSASLVGANAVKVIWNVYDEVNIDQYVVEASSNGVSFAAVGAVKATGNSAYSLVDNKASGTVVYYRIKSVDKGTGAVSYSAVVSIALNAANVASVNVYPNPVVGSELHLQTTNFKAGKLYVMLYDNQGKQIAQQALTYNGGTMAQTLALSKAVKAGTYQLVVTDGTSSINKTIFVVQ
jgi:hypothetical protein